MFIQTGRNWWRVLVLALLVIPALLACGGDSATPTSAPAATATTASGPVATSTVTGDTGSPTAAPTETVQAAQPTQTATGSTIGQPGTFANPVVDDNFPDPHVIKVRDTYYAYATTDGVNNYQTLTSKDLVNWTEGPDAMPQAAPWVSGRDFWAPEVLPHKNGKYILYYTAHAFEQDKQCIGVAVSVKPLGPFVDKSKAPLLCQANEGGSIDAHAFQDTDGKLYLLWKNDGNCCDLGMDTYLYSQQLSPDGLKLAGKPARLVKQDRSWEGPLVEAPTMWKQDGKYFLFFSANAYYNETYAVGYANCNGPLGPCRDAPENPILRSNEQAVGPGHQTIVKDDDGETWFVYHAWPPDAVGSVSPGRLMWIDRLVWQNGKPVVKGPRSEPQPVP